MATNISSPSAETRGIIYKIFPKGKDFPKAMNEDQRNLRKALKLYAQNLTRFFLKLREKQVKKRIKETIKLLPKEFLEKYKFKSKSELPSYVEECYGFGLPHKGIGFPECFMETTRVLLDVTGQNAERLIEKDTKEVLETYFKGYSKLYLTYPAVTKKSVTVKISKMKVKITPAELREGINRCKDLKTSLGLREKGETLPVYVSLMDSGLLYKINFTYTGELRSFSDTLTPEKKMNELDLKYYPSKESFNRKTFLKRWMKQRDINRILEKVAYKEEKSTKNERGEIWVSEHVILTTESVILENCKKCAEIYDKYYDLKGIKKPNTGKAEISRNVLSTDVIIDETTGESLGQEGLEVEKPKYVSRWFTSKEFKEAGLGLLTYKYNGRGTKADPHSLTKFDVNRIWRAQIKHVFYYRIKVGNKTRLEVEKEGKNLRYRISTILRAMIMNKNVTLRSDLKYVKHYRLKGTPEKYAYDCLVCKKWCSYINKVEKFARSIEKESLSLKRKISLFEETQKMKKQKKIKVKHEDLGKLIEIGFFK